MLILELTIFLDVLVYLLETCNEVIQQRDPYKESLSADVLESIECEEKEFCQVIHKSSIMLS